MRPRSILLLASPFLFGAGALTTPEAVGAAQGPDCKAVKMPDGTTTRMCRDAAGRWMPEYTPSARIPSRAEIVYEGTYDATAARRTRTPQRIDLSRMLLDAMTKKGDRFTGALTIKARFDGAAVRADISGTGGVDAGTLSGLVQNGQCRLVDARNTVVYEGRCDVQGFSGKIASTSSSRMEIAGRFQTAAAQVTDIGRQEAERAQVQRGREAERAELKRKCDAGSLTACVKLDSMH